MPTTIIDSNNFVDVGISLRIQAGSPVNFQRALLLSNEPGFVTYLNGLGEDFIEVSGTEGINEISKSGGSGANGVFNTVNFLTTYFRQVPTPPAIYVTSVNRLVTDNDPAEYYWDAVLKLEGLLDFYHVLSVGGQAQLLDTAEGVALAKWFEGEAITYTPSGGTAVNPSPPSRPMIQHLMCGDAANLIPQTTPAANNLAGALSTDSTTFTRTQLYFPDSPVIEDPMNMDPRRGYYQNPLNIAVVSQLCSGSRFNRAPGALSTANLSALNDITTVGSRTDYPMNYNPPGPNEVDGATNGLNNLLFYVQTSNPNVQFTYRTGATPNEFTDNTPVRYLDQTIAIDWLGDQIVTEYLDLITNAGPIPFEQSGFEKIRTILEIVFERGKRLGILDASFGPHNGEQIYIPREQDLTAQERQSRELGPNNPVTFITRLAGVVNKITIRGHIQP